MPYIWYGSGLVVEVNQNNPSPECEVNESDLFIYRTVAIDIEHLRVLTEAV